VEGNALELNGGWTGQLGAEVSNGAAFRIVNVKMPPAVPFECDGSSRVSTTSRLFMVKTALDAGESREQRVRPSADSARAARGLEITTLAGI
jgi:hypothetical protein